MYLIQNYQENYLQSRISSYAMSFFGMTLMAPLYTILALGGGISIGLLTGKIIFTAESN